MRLSLPPAAFLTAALACAAPALAQAPTHRHGGGPVPADTAAEGFAAAATRMHEGMDIAWSGDADRDFAAAMIPHHQGAIDMAQVVLRYGRDPEIRRMAEEVIAAQGKEIAALRRWLETHPK